MFLKNVLDLKRHFHLPHCGRGEGGKKKGRGAEKQSRKDRGGIASMHLDFYFIKKHNKRIFCMNLTMEDYECVHVILGVEKQKVKQTEIKENQ